MLRGSFDPDEVSFLLTDLSGHRLELGLRERERAIAAGRNYAEMLPIEFAPSAQYLALFDALLDQHAAQIQLRHSHPRRRCCDRASGCPSS